MALNLMIFGHEALLGCHSSRKLALASLVAERGQVGDVFFQRAKELQVETFFRSGRPDFVFARATTVFFGAFGLDGIGRGFFFLQKAPLRKTGPSFQGSDFRGLDSGF